MSRANLPPGPQYSLLDPRQIPFAVRWLRDPYAALLDVAARYGDVAFVRMGPVRLCVLNHPRYVRDVLVTHSRRFCKGGAFHLARSILGRGLLTSDGEFHLRQRRLAQPAFHPARIARYAEVMVSAADGVRQSWRPGQTIDVFREMSHLTLTIAAQALFGTRIGGQTDEVRLALTEVLKHWTHVLLPVANACQRLGLPVPAGPRLRRARARLDAILYRVIAERRAQPGDDLLSILAHAADDEGRMTDEQLRDEAMTFMLAGHETMATSLTWMWHLVSQHADVRSRWEAEIARELGDRLPSYDDLPRLTYTRQILAETLRLYPALWGFTRLALDDVPLGPYVIPRGSQVLASPFVVHRNPEVFSDPLRFHPDRWQDAEADASHDLSYFPFGGGVRRCIGEPFAWAEGPLVAATLLQRWRMEPVADERPVRPAPAFICRPQRPLLMTVQPRQAAAAPPPVRAEVVVSTS